MKGFTKDKKFHPIKKYEKVRKKRSITTIEGVKLIRKSRNENSIIKKISKNNIIEINKQVLKDPNIVNPNDIEPFAVREEIDQIISIVDSIGNTQNKKENIIEKASYLMGSISWVQPFVGGNKRTAFVSTRKFLQDNGYDISINAGEERDELIRLLNEIQNNRSELDPDTMQEIIFYIKSRIKKHG